MDKKQPEAQERKFWKRLCALNRFSFFYMGGGVARASDKSGNWIEVHSAQEIVDDAECEVSALTARITELDSQLAQRLDAADMATAAAHGFRDGAASAALASAPAQAAEPSITLDFKMATDLLGMFCGEPGLVTLQRGDEHCHSGPGLYAWYSDMPEEGAGFLGAEPDDEATPSAPSAPAQPAAQQGAAYAALPTSNYAGRVYEEGFLIGTCPLYTADQMHAFADATHTLRASHGQAPASVLHLVNSAFAEIAMAFPKAFALHKVGIADTAVREALAAPAPPPECETEAEKRAFAFGWFKALESERMKAESVQEDAMRYRWLRRWKGQEHEPPFTVQHEIDGTLWGGDLDATIDTARKQGEKQ